MCQAEAPPLPTPYPRRHFKKLDCHPGPPWPILNLSHLHPRRDPHALCLEEVGGGSGPTRKEATDLDVVKGGLAGDIIEQQQCWEQRGSEDIPCCPPPRAQIPPPSRAPTDHRPNSLGVRPCIRGLTMSVPIVGVRDAAEPLLASCVPDLQQQAPVRPPSLSLMSPAPSLPSQTPHLQLHLHAIHVQNFVLKQNQPAPARA